MSGRGNEHLEAQRAFYAGGEHAHLRPRGDDAYAAKLASEVARRAGIRREHRVLEVGAGFGRFTFALLEHCRSLVALDLSERALAELERTRAAADVPAERCRTLCGDLADAGLLAQVEPVDFVVGFFILHHLEDVGGALAALGSALAPGGRMVFLEPNRRNPLYLAQVMFCADMTWRDERGMFRLSAKGVDAAYRGAGLAPLATERFGFFPPQVFNRFPAARRLETRLEAAGWLEPLLPFLVLGAAKPTS